jgi:hypothetical protein
MEPPSHPDVTEEIMEQQTDHVVSVVPLYTLCTLASKIQFDEDCMRPPSFLPRILRPMFIDFGNVHIDAASRAIGGRIDYRFTFQRWVARLCAVSL